eukprot:CAMPEP_0181325004 /NCGR_PEP_ID=MMETSP1101-20121128/20678_1 /TAXON_ID=46948 /ORGANISM="Rhodomonas abbreviata, Strain Caron Lab Isolate" /LENGTH=72 /DNA_ID=CAMNT_0023433251 /DNA_START=205 /DNA_END=423 /DNA_ORIENTATION=-
MISKLFFSRLEGTYGPAPYAYWNGNMGYSDGTSECNYDDNGMYTCKLTQSDPTAYPEWMGPPETWSDMHYPP